MTNEQLELGLAGGKQFRLATRHESRTTRAAWWFGKMRTVVNGAMDWQSGEMPRPEQVFLPGTYRRVEI